MKKKNHTTYENEITIDWRYMLTSVSKTFSLSGMIIQTAPSKSNTDIENAKFALFN